MEDGYRKTSILIILALVVILFLTNWDEMDYGSLCFDDVFETFYAAALLDVEKAKETREYALDPLGHPNWFDASYISWPMSTDCWKKRFVSLEGTYYE